MEYMSTLSTFEDVPLLDLMSAAPHDVELHTLVPKQINRIQRHGNENLIGINPWSCTVAVNGGFKDLMKRRHPNVPINESGLGKLKQGNYLPVLCMLEDEFPGFLSSLEHFLSNFNFQNLIWDCHSAFLTLDESEQRVLIDFLVFFCTTDVSKGVQDKGVQSAQSKLRNHFENGLLCGVNRGKPLGQVLIAEFFEEEKERFVLIFSKPKKKRILVCSFPPPPFFFVQD